MCKANSRLKDISKRLLAVFIFVLLCGWNTTEAAAYDDVFEIQIQAVEKYDMANELLTYINQERKNQGMNELVMDRQLMEAALIRATEVNVLNSHWRPNGTRSTSDMDIEAVYENINSYAGSAKSIYDGWRKSSEGHQIPLTDSLCKSVGIGIVNHAAVALFSYNEPEVVMQTGTRNIMREMQLRLEFCQFSLRSGYGLEYGSTEQLMLVSTIEDRGIPVEIDPSQFQITSSNPQIINVLPNGSLSGKQTGTAEIEILWKDNLMITSKTMFSVKPLDIDIQGNAGFAYEKHYAYTGTEIRPEITITDKYGQELVDGTDYEVTYADNKDSGTGIITIIGKGNYCGTRYLSFSIEEDKKLNNQETSDTETQATGNESIFLANFNYITPDVTLDKNSFIYDGTPKTPDIEVTVKGEKLQAGIDYQIRYENNVKPGKGIVIVEGINRCSGVYKVTFDIVEQLEKITEQTKNNQNMVVSIVTTKATEKTVVNVEAKVTYTYTSSNSSGSNSVIRNVTESVSDKKEIIKSDKQAKKVIVKKPTIRKVKSLKRKQITVYWKKDKSVSGYQIQIATNKKMTKGRAIYSVFKQRASYTIKKMKPRKNYYVWIRSYKKVGGKVYYSKWSQKKKVKVKK